MIKRVSIEIIDHGLSNFDLPYKAIIGREYYNNFIRAAMRMGACYDVIDIPIHCANCHSFVVELYPLYGLIEEVLESPYFSDSFGIISQCVEKLDEGYSDYLDDPLDVDEPEVAIIFDRHCSCNHFFVGEPEEETGQIDFGMSSGRVWKYVGPRRYWS
jgi:hypothetical protein